MSNREENEGIVPTGPIIPFGEPTEENLELGDKGQESSGISKDQTGAILDLNRPLTLGERLVTYFQNFIPYDSPPTDTNYAPDGSESEKVIKTIGPYLLDFVPEVHNNGLSIFYQIWMVDELSKPFVRKMLQSSYGDLYDSLKDSDIGTELGLDDNDQSYIQINVLEQLVPEIGHLKKFDLLKSEARLDPYLILMCGPAEARGVLSDCMDLDKQKSDFIHDESSELMYISQIPNMIPVTSLKTILEISKKYNIKDIKQYTTAVNTIDQTLRGLSG